MQRPKASPQMIETPAQGAEVPLSWRQGRSRNSCPASFKDVSAQAQEGQDEQDIFLKGIPQFLFRFSWIHQALSNKLDLIETQIANFQYE